MTGLNKQVECDTIASTEPPTAARAQALLSQIAPHLMRQIQSGQPFRMVLHCGAGGQKPSIELHQTVKLGQ